MVGGVGRGLLQDADDPLRSRQVGIADAERNHIHTRPLLLLHLAVDLREQVGRDQPQALSAGAGRSFQDGSST